MDLETWRNTRRFSKMSVEGPSSDEKTPSPTPMPSLQPQVLQPVEQMEESQVLEHVETGRSRPRALGIHASGRISKSRSRSRSPKKSVKR